MQNLHPFDDADMLKSNFINAIAVLMVVIGALWCTPTTDRRFQASQARSYSSCVLSVAIVLLSVGATARYGVVVPAHLGSGDGYVSSIATSLARAYAAGLMLLLIAGFRFRKVLLLPAVVLIVIELVCGILLFRKSDIVATLIFVVLAHHYMRPTVLRLVTGMMFVGLAFAIISPLVKHGREQAISLGGERHQATLSQRINIVAKYVDDWHSRSDIDSSIEAALSRISYVNAATMVISRYDHGEPGDTLQHAFAAFVPRLLWPDKPVLTAHGTDLYMAVTGRQGTSISPGLFAEAYWNFGWLGLPLLMVPFGMILAQLSRSAVQAIACQRWIYLPVVLMSIHIGLRVDGHFVADVIGATFAVVLLWCGLRLAEPLLAGRPQPRAG